MTANFSRWTLVIILFVCPRLIANDNAGAEASRKFALLVGCTTYPNLPQRRSLEGPGNDVRLVRKILIDKFDLAEESIHTLADAEGEKNWPTYANIEREFDRLIKQARAGDYIFLLLAGHGSQQRDQDKNNQVDAEPDGYDEVFLPRDIGSWQAQSKQIENAISDDQIRDWITALVAKGAFVFFMADSCHSGTVARGDGEDQVSRNVPPRKLGVPETEGSGDTEKKPQQDWLDLVGRGDGHTGVVALYGARSNEEAIEDRLGEGGERYGRLSYSFAQVFEEADRPITYRELGQRLYWKFAHKGWTRRSTPGIEGTDLSREVLGAREWPGRSRLRLQTVASGYQVSGGALHGVTTGSILAVYPQAGDENGDELLGYVQITQSEPLTAWAKPIEFKGHEAPKDLPNPARCQVEVRDFGEMQLAVRVDVAGIEDEKLAQQHRRHVIATLKKLANERDSLVRLHDEEGSSVDWVAVVTKKGVYLQHADSPVSRSLEDPTAKKRGEIVGPYESGPDLESSLRRGFIRLSQAANLRKLAQPASRIKDPLIDIELNVIRQRNGDPSDAEGRTFEAHDAQSAEVDSQEILALKIKNTGLKPVSVAVFYVDSLFSISPFFPRSYRDVINNKIGTGERLYRPVRFNINDKTLGKEDVIVIAVPAEDQQAIDDLLLLQQRGLASRTRSAGNDPETLGSPLGRLIDNAMNGTRASSDPDAAPQLGTYAIRKVSWNVVERRDD